MPSSQAAADAAKAAAAAQNTAFTHGFRHCATRGPGFLKVVGGVTILFFAAAGVRSVFGPKDRHWGPPGAYGNGPFVEGAEGTEQPRGFKGWAQMRMRMLDERDNKLRAEFDQKLEELKQTINK